MSAPREDTSSADLYGIVLKDLGPLRVTADGNRIDLRILETRRGRVVDVRQWLGGFATHTRKGVRLYAQEFSELLKHATEITALLSGGDAPASESTTQAATANNGAGQQ